MLRISWIIDWNVRVSVRAVQIINFSIVFTATKKSSKFHWCKKKIIHTSTVPCFHCVRKRELYRVIENHLFYVRHWHLPLLYDWIPCVTFLRLNAHNVMEMCVCVVCACPTECERINWIRGQLLCYSFFIHCRKHFVWHFIYFYTKNRCSLRSCIIVYTLYS